MKKPHQQVFDHLQMGIEQLEHWQKILRDLADAQPNIPFKARAYIHGAHKEIGIAVGALQGAYTECKEPGSSPLPDKAASPDSGLDMATAGQQEPDSPPIPDFR